MSSDNNIIALAHESNLNATSTHATAESIVKAVKYCASNHLKKLISKLFENAENILLSEKMLAVISNGESRVQQNYIEEMQSFFLKKEQVTEFFNTELINYCDQSIKPSQFRTKTTTLDDATDLLLSAQGEHLEESVTITNLIAKGHKLYNHQLSTIEKRFGIIAPINNINKNNIPFGPEHLCNAFKKSLHIQNPSPELILIVYSLFDNHVIQQLADSYSEINSIMSDAGILPKLMSEPGTDPYVHFLGTTTKSSDNNPGKSFPPKKTDKQIERKQRKETKNRSEKSNSNLFGTLQHFAMMKKHMASKSKVNAESTNSRAMNKQLASFLDASYSDISTTSKKYTRPSSEESNDIASREIEKYTRDTDVPETVLDFLLNTWKNVLAYIQSNIGESSLTWQYALSITSKLVASTQPKLTQKDKQNLLTEIPIIVNGLQDGLTLISYNSTKIQQFFNALELIHTASLQGELIDIYDLSSDDMSTEHTQNAPLNQQSNDQTNRRSDQPSA